MTNTTPTLAALQAEYSKVIAEFYELDRLYEASKARVTETYNRLCIAMGQPEAQVLPLNVIQIDGDRTNHQLWVEAEQIPAAEPFTPPSVED